MPKPSKWGRTETIIWPPHSPICTYGAIFLSIVAAGLFVYLRFSFVLTPLQQFYVPYYLRTQMAGVMRKSDKYQLLMVAGTNGGIRLATDRDVAPGRTLQPDGQSIPLELSPAPSAQGMRSLYRSASTVYLNPALHAWLKQYVFGGEELLDIFKLPLAFGLLALALQLPFSVRKDIQRRKVMKYGRRLRGPILLSPKEFNRIIQGDGIGIKTDDLDAMIRIPARAESQHMQIIGDTGAGKTAVMFQVLRQIQGRGDAAIIYDPACEFIQRFYDSRRGDIILNPLDKRCPYWGPSEELRRRSEAKALSESLFQPTQNKKGARGNAESKSPFEKINRRLRDFGCNPIEAVFVVTDRAIIIEHALRKAMRSQLSPEILIGSLPFGLRKSGQATSLPDSCARLQPNASLWTAPETRSGDTACARTSGRWGVQDRAHGPPHIEIPVRRPQLASQRRRRSLQGSFRPAAF